MINAQNLRTPTSDEAREIGRKGGLASAEARKKKKLLRECLQELLQMEYDTGKGKKTGSEVLAAMLMKKAMAGDVKAFETLRDTAGEKPTDKLEVEQANLTIDWGAMDDDN